MTFIIQEWDEKKLNSNQMEDQIGTVLHWSHQKEPKQAKKSKIKSRGGTWIGLGFLLLLLYPQTHMQAQPSELHSKSK